MGGTGMNSDADLVRHLSNEVFIKGNLSTFNEIVAAEFVSHDPPPGASPTREGLLEVAKLVTNAFSSRAFEFDDYVSTADGRVVESWAMTATHSGEAFGLPASGQRVRVRGVEIWRCANGKIVEHWGA